ncbi:MAG: methyltransferase domain-containing protein [Tepidisphaeraceae bacterium]
MTQYKDFGYADAAPAHTAAYLIPAIRQLAGDRLKAGARVLDVGCGNGAICSVLAREGCHVVGLDLSEQGIAIARSLNLPNARFELLAADANVLKNLNETPFDVVISTEVVEHVYDPRSFMAGCVGAVRVGGMVLLSTPYHGYLKNVAITLAGKWDWHHNPLWDGGHIKFWSQATLGRLMREAGLSQIGFAGAGRLPWLWKSMVMSGIK